MSITTSSVFLDTLARAGVTFVFANWGSDHPALLEDLERQRVIGAKDGRKGTTSSDVVTCPNEMVALCAAHGYAQLTRRPAAVIVHVDVGTQALAGAVHNVNRSNTPVLIYAGASPFTAAGEIKGSRNEWIMWCQDVPDQAAIVRQYMRYTGQINSGKHVDKAVMRALQIATSEPTGPVYLWGRREAMEEDLDESYMGRPLGKWPPIAPSGLAPDVIPTISDALLKAKNPIIITSHVGRNPAAVPLLAKLSNLLAIPVFTSCPSAVNVPFSHQLYTGVGYGNTEHDVLNEADVVLVIESEVPWIEMRGVKPREDARVFVLDGGDPLRTSIGFWHADAEQVCKANAEVALGQILQSVEKLAEAQNLNLYEDDLIKARGIATVKRRQTWLQSMESAESSFAEDGSFTVPNLMGVLRKAIHAQPGGLAKRTLVMNEAISNYPHVWSHLRPESSADGEGNGMTMFTSGAASLGWALGASVGACLAERERKKQGSLPGYDLTVAVIGDGSYLFGVPSSAFWIARKYETPFLTIVLNNGGWRSPKLSMLGVYPQGHGSKVSGSDLTVGFGPDAPDYSQIAVAASAGWAWGKRVHQAAELSEVIAEAIRVVVEEKRCAVVDCVLESI